jgi:formate dehydrogenase iron-sulfur subunit
MGGLTPMPVRSAIAHFPDDFLARTPGRENQPQHATGARTEGTA